MKSNLVKNYEYLLRESVRVCLNEVKDTRRQIDERYFTTNYQNFGNMLKLSGFTDFFSELEQKPCGFLWHYGVLTRGDTYTSDKTPISIDVSKIVKKLTSEAKLSDAKEMNPRDRILSKKDLELKGSEGSLGAGSSDNEIGKSNDSTPSNDSPSDESSNRSSFTPGRSP